MGDAKVTDRVKNEDIHEAWAIQAAAQTLARFVQKKANGDDVVVTIKGVPTKDDKVLIPFDEFTVLGITDRESWAKLWDVAEEFKGNVENEDGEPEPADNPLPKLIDYAYGLTRRSKIRVQYERGFADPEAADRKLLAMLIKQGRCGANKDKDFNEQVAKVQAKLRQMVELMKADTDEEEDE
jgi:hypothetical protein